MAVALVFETHAITTDNERGVATGWLPGQLSERGRRTATELGERRRSDGIAAVLTSDLGRAIETVDIAFRGTSVPVRRDWRLRECNYGSRNGMPTAVLERERGEHIDEPWPGGESYRDVVVRTAAFLDDVRGASGGSRVLLVSHSANKWALDHLLLGHDLAALVAAGLVWQPGWEYVVPTGWKPPAHGTPPR